MSYVFENFSSPGGPTILNPPKLDISIMIGIQKISEKTCDALYEFVLSQEKKIIDSYQPVPVAGLYEGLTTRWLDYNFLSLDHPEIANLKALIKEAYLEYLSHNNIPRWNNNIQCWANVLRAQDKFQPHEHNYANRCITATISLSETDTNTIYHFPFKLKKNGTNVFTKTIRVPTLKGSIIMLPGWVTHMTSPVPPGVTRITLGLDIIDILDVGVPLPFDSGTSFSL